VTEAEYVSYRAQALATQAWALAEEAKALAMPDRPSTLAKRARPWTAVATLAALVVELLDEVKTKQ
jgi:hypothetical protein